MRLSVVHRTAYQYDAAVSFGIQYLRLTPYANASQRVIRWNVEAPGTLTRWTDAFGNLCDTLIFDGPGDRIEIVATGEVETSDTSGVLPDEQGGVPVETYLRATPLTAPDEIVADFAAPTCGGRVARPAGCRPPNRDRDPRQGRLPRRRDRRAVLGFRGAAERFRGVSGPRARLYRGMPRAGCPRSLYRRLSPCRRAGRARARGAMPGPPPG